MSQNNGLHRKNNQSLTINQMSNYQRRSNDGITTVYCPNYQVCKKWFPSEKQLTCHLGSSPQCQEKSLESLRGMHLAAYASKNKDDDATEHMQCPLANSSNNLPPSPPPTPPLFIKERQARPGGDNNSTPQYEECTPRPSAGMQFADPLPKQQIMLHRLHTHRFHPFS